MIRKANLRDIPEICDLLKQMSPDVNLEDAKATFRLYIQSNYNYFLWVYQSPDAEVVGTVMMHLQHKLSYNGGIAAHIEDLVVDKDHRGNGIGECLLHEAITTAQDRSCYKIILSCSDKTVGFYEKFGFKRHSFGMRLNCG